MVMLLVFIFVFSCLCFKGKKVQKFREVIE